MSVEPCLPHILVLYRDYSSAGDQAAFARNVSQFYSTGTLQRLVAHSDRDVRRAAVMALGLLGDYSANDTLGSALSDSDRLVRTLADSGIRQVWMRAADENGRLQLGKIVRLSAAKQFHVVIRLAGRLIRRCPELAESWHQRGFAHHSRGEWREAIRDCNEALEINPYHFLAAGVLGKACLETGNPITALECFRRALRLNPDLEGVRMQVYRLARLVEGTR